MRRYWLDFTESVGVKMLRDFDREAMEVFHDRVWGEAQRKGYTSTYVKKRLEAVPTVLRIALRKGGDTSTIRRVLDLCAAFEKPGPDAVAPNPIDPSDFRALLEVSDAKWRAVLLLALNCALYPSEVAAVEQSNIDLAQATFVMDRGKTGRPRIAVLGKRTCIPIRDYLAAELLENIPFFVNANGTAYNGSHITRNFRRRSAEAGLADEVTFDRVRDGNYSAAIEGGADLTEAKLIAGHACGIPDHYIKHAPKMVAKASAAIEVFYFGLRLAGSAADATT